MHKGNYTTLRLTNHKAQSSLRSVGVHAHVLLLTKGARRFGCMAFNVDTACMSWCDSHLHGTYDFLIEWTKHVFQFVCNGLVVAFFVALCN